MQMWTTEMLQFLAIPIKIKEEGTIAQKRKRKADPSIIKEHKPGGDLLFASILLRTELYDPW